MNKNWLHMEKTYSSFSKAMLLVKEHFVMIQEQQKILEEKDACTFIMGLIIYCHIVIFNVFLFLVFFWKKMFS